MISAAAHTLDASDPDDDLPGHPEPRFEVDIPPPANWKHYRTIPGCDGRYAVNVAGGTPHVFDLHAQRALRPIQSKGGRLRFRINYGANKPVRRPFLSRLVCQAVHGAPQYYRNPKTRHHAHHVDKNRTNDHAGNLVWATPKQHAKIERNRPRTTPPNKHMATQRTGEKNSRNVSLKAKRPIMYDDIVSIIRHWHKGGLRAQALARAYSTTPTTIYRIIRGETRAGEVVMAYYDNALTPPPQAVANLSTSIEEPFDIP